MTIDLNEEQLQILEEIQQQYGLDSIEAAANMLFQQRMMHIRQELTGDLGLPQWVAK
jgi:Mg2+/citrate symporter